MNFSTLVYLPVMDMYARPIIITPRASQPSVAAYTARGIYTTEEIDVVGEDGVIYSDQKTIVDIRDIEFSVLPIQHDLIEIPIDDSGPSLGIFEIVDADINGGGITTLTIRKYVTS